MGEGEVPADPGGGGAREVHGGAKGCLVEQRRAELVLERLPQRADRKFLLSLQLSNTGFFIRSLADKRRLSQWLTDIA